MITARFRFFSAPATISEAEALPAFTSTAMRVGVVAVVRVGALLLAQLVGQADGGDDGALDEEEVGDLDRLLEQAAGVAAQVEHQALQAAAGLRVCSAARRSAACRSRVVLPWKFLSRT